MPLTPLSHASVWLRVGFEAASEWSIRHSTSSTCTQPRSRSRYTVHAHHSPSVIHHANQVLCATSRSRYFHVPCASLTVILSLCPVISALLRPLAFLLLLLLTCLVECLGHPRGSCIVHECLDCINSLPQRSSPRSMIGNLPSAPFRIALQRY